MLIAFVFGFTISFNPLRVSFPNYMSGIGWVLILVGLICVNADHYLRGKKAGREETIELLRIIAKEQEVKP